MQQAEPYMVWNGEKTENKGGGKTVFILFLDNNAVCVP